MTIPYGATPAEWQRFVGLGLGTDLLPVVCRPGVPISPKSKLDPSQVGKIPTRLNQDRQLMGFAGWSDHVASEQDLARWQAQPDYGLCVITRRVRALDVDVEDERTVALIGELLHDGLLAEPFSLPVRGRADSARRLYMLLCPDEGLRKRVLKVRPELGGGKIELLATGQQFVACGTHPRGARYTWHGDPAALPEVELAALDVIWEELGLRFGVQKAPAAVREGRGSAAGAQTQQAGSGSDAVPAPTAYAGRDPAGKTLAQAASLLPQVPGAGEYDAWISVGQALHHEFDGDDRALDLWDAWSAPAANYAGREAIEAKWASFGARNAATAAGGAPAGPVATWASLERRAEQGRLQDLADLGGVTVDEVRAIELVADFEVAAASAPTGPGDGAELGDPVPDNYGAWPGSVAAPRAVKVPLAEYLTTDQANMNRIARRFKSRVLYTVGEWYTWTGTHWAPGKAGVELLAMELSRLIGAEAKAWEEKGLAVQAELNAEEGRGDSADQVKLVALREKLTRCQTVADSLYKWAAKSESAATQAAAVRMLAAAVEVKKEKLDRDPWLLNCPNGTVDLRTGVLRGHVAEDYITRVTPVDYVEGAACPIWERTLAQITIEEGRETRPLVRFLQRWFGYCATGATDEQKFVVHWGSGSNGKSTIIKTVAGVLGSDYAATAPLALMVSKKMEGNNAPYNEIADLHGRRMVTAHESEDGAVLREGLVKQATGDDRLKGRRLYAQFFEFDPTHKLQLLTNHKPQIKGSDHAIWRRVLLMPYVTRFGTAEEVALGQAQFIKDERLAQKLLDERPAILAWIVSGAVAWYRDGLAAPDTVLAASADYRAEQDRIAQFVDERCELGAELKSVITTELYPAYTGWCGENGVYSLSKSRFLGELERLVPDLRKDRERDSNRRKVQVAYGISVVVGSI